MRSAEPIQALIAVSGQGLLFTNGNNVGFMKDDCPSYISYVDAKVCIPKIEELLEPCIESCSIQGRSFSAFAMSNEDLSEISVKTKYLYVASKILRKIYRMPIIFKNGEVDVPTTRLYLKEGKSGASGIEQWILAGNGDSGFKDGPALEASFVLIADLEVSRNDTLLYISDFSNHRVRVVHLESKQVTTIIGNGKRCWKEGFLGVNQNDEGYSCSSYHGYALADSPNGIELDENNDLYVAMTLVSKIGKLNYVDHMKNGPTTFQEYCAMQLSDVNLVARNGMTCAKPKPRDYKSCFLNKVFDVVSYNYFLIAAVIDGIMVINKMDMNCSRIGGLDWKFNAWGSEDGQNGTSRFHQPFRMTMSQERGILYIDDYQNKAIRRIYINGKCTCPPGMIYVAGGRSCYNPSISQATSMLISCPEGFFSIENENICRDCKEAVFFNMIVPQCETWKNFMAIKNSKLVFSDLLQFNGLGSKQADYFGGPTRPMGIAWDAIFSTTNGIGYKRGLADGYAPSGKVYHTLDYNQITEKWELSRSIDKNPVVILPGLWYPCNVNPLDRTTLSCECAWHVGEFDSAENTDCRGKSSWHCLRLAAVDAEARTMDVGTKYDDLVKFNEWEYKYSSWSKYFVYGTDVEQRHISGCEEGGPCFPVFFHIRQKSPVSIPIYGNPPKGVGDTIIHAKGNFDASANMKCGMGWPMHAYCSNGYMWVGAHNSSVVNHMNLGSKTIACISCLPGTFSNVDLSKRKIQGGPYKCEKCPPGTFNNEVGATTCLKCPADTYAESASGSTKCIPCGENQYSREGSISSQGCTACVPGTGSCNDCPAGYYQNLPGRSVCVICRSGYYSSAKKSVDCTACPVGKYQDEIGGQICKECAEGSFTRQVGSTSCERCADNFTCKLFINGECGRGCGLNHFWNVDTKECVRCGSYSLNSHFTCATSFSACQYGNENRTQYISQYGSASQGGDVISNCPRGTQADEDFLRCSGCPKGKYGLENGGCEQCPPGSYSNQEGMTSCIACPVGTFNDRFGESRECIACIQGTYAMREGQIVCDDCPAGTYGDEMGLIQCKECVNGTFSNETRRTSPCSEVCDPLKNLYSGMGASVCLECDDGYVNSEVQCVGCGLGMYAEAPVCKICPPGSINNITHRGVGVNETCLKCLDTEYTPDIANGKMCISVREGYQVSIDKRSEVACQIGYFRNNQSTRCIQCPAGSFSSSVGNSVCSQCPSGKYQDRTGESFCATCLSGYVSINVGARQCTTCLNGSIPNVNSTGCIPCERNTYKVRQNQCGKCPLGSISREGSASIKECRECHNNYLVSLDGNCVLCPAGSYKKQTNFDYQNNIAIYTCELCPDGTHNPFEGAAGIWNCSSCKGFGYVPSANKSSCVKCPVGQSGNGRECIDCPPGTYSDDGLMCKACPFGFYNNESKQESCHPCDAGSYSNQTGSRNCSLCPIKTHQPQNGSSSCLKCTSSLGFANVEGLAQCIPRRNSCNVGEYMSLNYEYPDRDHVCIPCGFCSSNQFIVIEYSVEFLDFADVDENDFLSLYCPGNTTRPLFSCIENKATAGTRLYIDMSSLNAGSSRDPTGSVGMQIGTVGCTDIQNFGDEELDKYVGYVAGVRADVCYVGCKFGLNERGLIEYQNLYGSSVGENPRNNVFYTRMLEKAKVVCMRCPLEPCPFGLYRPRWENSSCGPPCFLDSALCPVGDKSGCVRSCDLQPANSVVIGGSRELDGRTCDWQCQIGYFLKDDNSGCLSCLNETNCAEGYVPVQVAECMPTHYNVDVCKRCEFVEGGTAISWDRMRGKCIYRCARGYYGVDASTNCLPCRTNLSMQRCAIGEYRDVDSCFLNGSVPDCKPCYVNTDSLGIVSFHTDGGYSAMECVATCHAGYNAYFRHNEELVPVRTVRTFSPNISCRLCRVDSGLPCQGLCSGGRFRNMSAADGDLNGCVKCKDRFSCQAGFFTEYCTGNGTSDARCIACDPKLLIDPITNSKVRIFVPNDRPNQGVCPTACIVNHVAFNGTCIPCAQYVKEVKKCDQMTKVSSFYTVGQPLPCDFVYSHWNASDNVAWWEPKYTPEFMREFIQSGSIQQRKDICWACPPGRGTFQGDGDLCEVLPGYGKVSSEEIQRRSLIVDPKALNLMTLDVRQPSRRVLQRRRLLQVSGQTNIGSGLILQKCRVGYYKTRRNTDVCIPCPEGTSTIGEGSTSISSCRCLYGYRRQLERHFGDKYDPNNISNELQMQINSTFLFEIPCVPCSANTHRPLRISNELECSKCPPNETTFGKINATKCSCSHGFYRSENGSCILCPENHFCIPCSDDDINCPPGNSFIESCFSNSTSKIGSSSVGNCTCVEGTFRLKRKRELYIGSGESIIEVERKTKSNLYCLGSPPFAIYNKQSMMLECPRNWIALWDAGRLVGCTLCRPGFYSVRDPSKPFLINGIETYMNLDCRVCPTGKYTSSSVAIGDCDSCPFQLTTTRNGSKSVDDCGCPAFKVLSSNGSVCLGCGKNEYFQNETCVSCPPNSIIDARIGMGTSAEQCICDRGYFKDLSGKCSECPLGTYSPLASNAGCRKCPIGSTTAQIGSIFSNDCIVCLEGYTLIPTMRKCINSSISFFFKR